jgi:hypothetical protein
MRRRIVLDADVNWKLAHELRKRGRVDATALRLEELHELKDGALLKALAGSYEPFVLVTWDNKMPRAHAAELRHFGSTVAVVNRSGIEAWTGTAPKPGSNRARWATVIDVRHRATGRGALPADRPYPAPHPIREAPAGDDRKLEALLAAHGDPCTPQQLAGALDWTLDRVLAAAARLEARLANTGQTLERHGHHTLALRARADLIPPGAKGRCRRHALGTDRPSHRPRAPSRPHRQPRAAHLGRPHRARRGPPPPSV